MSMSPVFPHGTSLTRARFLEPGGWIEIQDYDMPCRSNDGTLHGTKLELWADKMVEGTHEMGRPVDQSHMYRQWMEEAGFRDIEEQRFVWPTNSWPRDKKLKELGKWTEVNLSEGMDGFTLAIFTRVLGWTKDEVDVLCAQVGLDFLELLYTSQGLTCIGPYRAPGPFYPCILQPVSSTDDDSWAAADLFSRPVVYGRKPL